MSRTANRKGSLGKGTLALESLERRDLFSVDVAVSGAELIIDADTSAFVTVTEDVDRWGREYLEVTYLETENGLKKESTIDVTERIDKIIFDGSMGDDYFNNRTSIRSEIHGRGGDDTLKGGSGVDVIRGADGEDRIFGNGGDDFLYGGPMDDLIVGGKGSDKIYGCAGVDKLYGDHTNPFKDRYGAGDDKIWGGTQRDYIIGGGGADKIRPGGGDNRIWGGSILGDPAHKDVVTLGNPTHNNVVFDGGGVDRYYDLDLTELRV